MFIEDKTIQDIIKVEKNISSSDDNSTDLKLVLPTTLLREVGDEDEIELPNVGNTDAPIEIPYEEDDNGIHK